MHSILPMSCSTPLTSFTYDLLCYLNRDQLERFSIVCSSLKNFIERYFHSKPYRLFNELCIRGGTYALNNNGIQWHPNRNDNNVQQFSAAPKCSVDESDNYRGDDAFHAFTEMRPYLGRTVRIESTFIIVAGDTIYTQDCIEEMESITYLWRNRDIYIYSVKRNARIHANDFQLILNSPTILQCRMLFMDNAHFSFKQYKVLYAVEDIAINYGKEDINPEYLLQFIEQPGVKPVIIFRLEQRKNMIKVVDHFRKAFSSADLPNAFKILFQRAPFEEPLSEFRETNNTSGEKLQLKKGLPAAYQHENYLKDDFYTLERSSI